MGKLIVFALLLGGAGVGSAYLLPWGPLPWENECHWLERRCEQLKDGTAVQKATCMAKKMGLEALATDEHQEDACRLGNEQLDK